LRICGGKETPAPQGRTDSPYFFPYWMLVTFKLVGGAGRAEIVAALNAIPNVAMVEELFTCVQVNANGAALV